MPNFINKCGAMGYFDEKGDWFNDFFRQHSHAEYMNGAEQFRRTYERMNQRPKFNFSFDQDMGFLCFEQRYELYYKKLQVDIIEDAGLKPLDALEKRQQGNIIQLRISSFLFNLYTKSDKLFWLVMNHYDYFKELYQVGNYYTLFKLLYRHAGRYRQDPHSF
jgi:hypothetical protein